MLHCNLKSEERRSEGPRTFLHGMPHESSCLTLPVLVVVGSGCRQQQHLPCQYQDGANESSMGTSTSRFERRYTPDRAVVPTCRGSCVLCCKVARYTSTCRKLAEMSASRLPPPVYAPQQRLSILVDLSPLFQTMQGLPATSEQRGGQSVWWSKQTLRCRRH